MDISKLIKLAKVTGVLDSVAKKQGLDTSVLSKVIETAGPEILGQLAKNAANPNKVEGLDKALDANHSATDTDGDKILGHIFGDKKQQIEEKVAKTSGLDMSKIAPIMAMLAPLIMAQLGSQKKKTKTTSSGLGGLIGGMLDKNNNGSVIDDLAGIAIGQMFGKKS